jgi:O-antigen/teichoic acid export membrane protein
MTSTTRILFARLSAGSLSRNGVFALGQSLTVTACMFLAYRLVIAHAGIERFGVWSLLLAGSAFARIGDVSGGGALARFVALASRDDGSRRARDIVHTVLLTSLAFNAGIGLAVWVAAPFALPLFVPPAYMADAQALMPYVVASIVLGALAVAVTSGIDGAQRADRRALVVAGSSVLFLAVCAVLVPLYGVLGFGAAQVLQQAAMLALGWLVLRRHVGGLGWFPCRWRQDAFAETTGYAVKLNAIGVMSLLFEPLAKFAFNHAGGPGLVALYELASRLVVQVRGLAVAAATPLVPAFAARSGSADPAFRAMLEKATRAAALAAIGAAAVTLAAAPVMSLVVLGRLSPELLGMNAALTAGWSINILVVPIYLAGQALGVLRWNFLSHATIAASVVMGAFLLVPLTGPAGLVGVIAAGLGLSTLVTLLGNAHAFGAMDILSRLRLYLLAGSFAIVLLCSVAGLAVVLIGI